MTLEEQKKMLEKALSERMLNHAIVILRRWLSEIYKDNKISLALDANIGSYNDQLNNIAETYSQLFNYYLTSEDPNRDSILDAMTGDMYALTDRIYAMLCLKRGIAPTMHGFNPNNKDSVINYFGASLQLSEDDLNWLRDVVDDPSQGALGLLACSALGQNIRKYFNEDAMLVLIDMIRADNQLVGDQALAYCIIILAKYDLRIDFFPNIQKAFEDAIEDGEIAFEVLTAMIRSSRTKLRDLLQSEDFSTEDLPDVLRELLSDDQEEIDIDKIASWLPEDENKSLLQMIESLPQTWVFETLLDGDEERRNKVVSLYVQVGMSEIAYDCILLGRLDLCPTTAMRADMLLYQGLYEEALDEFLKVEAEQGKLDKRTIFRIGWCAMLAGDYNTAEEYMLIRLRHNPNIEDYINYGHLCWLRGDRLTAYENYREARRLAATSKRFMLSFRPDRRMLAEHGIPLSDIYMMEDQLLSL